MCCFQLHSPPKFSLPSTGCLSESERFLGLPKDLLSKAIYSKRDLLLGQAATDGAFVSDFTPFSESNIDLLLRLELHHYSCWHLLHLKDEFIGSQDFICFYTLLTYNIYILELKF